MALPLPISGCRLVVPDAHVDERGSFVTWFRSPKDGEGIMLCQGAVSVNHGAGTLRGMHYQVGDNPQHKLVRCLRGRIHDVVLDLRSDSDTFGRSFDVELSPTGASLVIPAGCAHGFFTLEDETEVLYLLSASGDRTASRGVRWDDPRFALQWPGPPLIISAQDASWPDFEAGSK